MTGVDGMLAGVRVMDFTHFLAGPYATMILAEMGADVIKIEDPDRQDSARRMGPYFQGDQSIYFAALNPNKRSLSVRMSSDAGRAALLDLARRSDVVVDNFRPGVMRKLALDRDALAVVNDRLITCSLSGFGATGPRAGDAAYDYTIQAIAGVMSFTGEPDAPPGKAGVSYIDHSGGLSAALAICAALFQRTQTGAGRHLDLSLFDVQVSMLSYLAAWHLNAAFEPTRLSHGAHPSLVPAQTFATRDGWVSIFVGNDDMWSRLADALDDPRLRAPEYVLGRDRLRNRAALVEVLEDIVGNMPTSLCVDRLSLHGVSCAAVNSLGEALADPQVAARDLIRYVDSDTGSSYRYVRGPISLDVSRPPRPAPALGEHTEEVLAGIGYTPAQIQSLLSSGVAVLADGERPVRSNS